MTNISVPLRFAIIGPSAVLVVARQRLRHGFSAFIARLDQRLLADRLEHLRKTQPGFHADLRLESENASPVSPLPQFHPLAVVASYLTGKRL